MHSRLAEIFPNLKISRFDTWGIHFSDVVHSDQIDKTKLKASRFANPGEGKLFANLISNAIETGGDEKVLRIIDLGCGSSLPTISAVINSRANLKSVVAVDLDSDAIEVSKSNANVAGLESQYSFVNDDLRDFLKTFQFRIGDLIVANPPYVPVKDNETDEFFLPINGGTDGLEYLRPIIETSRKAGIPTAILCSSLSSPFALLSEIKKAHEIRYAEGTLVKFGQYLKQERIRTYLDELKGLGQIEFYEDPDGENEFLTLGLVLQKF